MFATAASSYSRVSVQFVKLPCDVASGGFRVCITRLLFPRIRQPCALYLCLSLKFFFLSRTSARRSSSSLSSLLLYRYVLLMRMLSFSISLSQLLSRSSRFLSVCIHPPFPPPPPTHVLVFFCLHISVIQLPSVFLQFC